MLEREMAGTDKQPLSLNERHSRLIQDLSVSQSAKRPPFSRFIHGEDKNQSTVRLEERRLLFQTEGFDCETSQFSAIADFDSTSPDDRITAGEELAVRDNPGKPPSEIRSNVVYGKMNTAKVKIEGRRRLCKLSSKNDDRCKSNVAEESFHEGPIPEISDYRSPPPFKAMAGDDCGQNEIRNILDDLTSRLDILSIEKKTKPRMTEQKCADTKKVIDQGKDDAVDYASAGSSFSHSSDKSGSSSETAQSGVGQGSDSKQNVDESESESGGDNFVESVNASKNMSTRQVKETKKVQRKERVVPKPSVSHVEAVNYDDDDDCILLTTEKLPGDRRSYGHKWVEDHGDSSVVDLEDDENVDEVDSGDRHVITMKGPKSAYTLSGKIGNMLYPHQREGLKWLWSLHCQGKGGILGDDMGLGKTMQICGYLAGLFSSRLTKRVMVVAPKTLIPHWIKELSVVGLSDKTKEYFGTCPKTRQYELQYVLQEKGILLTTYDIVRNNSRQLSGSSFEDESDEDGPIWDYMILDEGHLIKNPNTQRAKSLLDIPSAHRIIISGTPIQNNLKELWALFNFCCPDLLGDKKDFKERYEYPILRGNEKSASERDKRVGSMVAKELRDRIQPYFLRRLKTEVFSEANETESSKLSKKNEIIVWLRLTNCQRHLYEAFLKSELVLSAFDGSPLAAITILKKICDHPLLLTKRAAEDVLEGMDSMLNQEDRGMAEKLAKHMADFTDEEDFQEKHDNLSCKISFILSLLEKLIPKGHNVLIFSQTRKMLNLIQEALVFGGYEFLRIDGTTKASDRVKIVNDFQDGCGAPIFLLTSQVGGLGLTLTKADRVIVVDPAWNPSTDNQSVDRAYRIGQRKDVIVYRLMTCATIEEKIYRMQIFKGGLFKTATEHKEQTRYFSQQDLKDLFKLPKEEDGGFDISITQRQLHEEHYRQIKLNDSLKDHIKFLESLGIGGVSHHSLLYSKTEPASTIMLDEDNDVRRKGVAGNKYSYSSSQSERVVDGAEFAFKPKDVHTSQKKNSPMSSGKQTESDIKERISRLSQILSNKATVSKLPDRGEKIRKQIVELNLELDNLVTAQSSSDIIDLDDVADNLKRTLIV